MDRKTKDRALKIIALLEQAYPDAHCALHHHNPLELLVATILSAQCTDVRVNQVTETLFKKYQDAGAFARVDQEELENDIRSTGFFRNKARSIINCCQALLDEHDGKVPATMEELTRLAGVGRKTANVILGNCFSIPGVVVDTHVGRLAGRMGLTAETDPEKVEQDLMKLVPLEKQVQFSHQMIDHGRRVCNARKPLCEVCTIAPCCPRVGA